MNKGHRLHEAQIEGAGRRPRGRLLRRALRRPGRRRAARALRRARHRRDLRALRSHVDEAAGGRGVVLDLSGATFVDSSMLKELLRASAELARYETRLVLAGIPPAVRRLLDLTRTAELFTLADDRDAALALVDAQLGGPRTGGGRRGGALGLALLRGRAGAEPREPGVQEVVAGRGREHGRHGAGGRRRVQPQADERERASRRRCSACRSAARRRRSAAGALAGACRRRALLHERLADPRSRPSRGRSASRA